MKVMRHTALSLVIILSSYLLVSVNARSIFSRLWSKKTSATPIVPIIPNRLDNCKVFMEKTDELSDFNLETLSVRHFREKLNIFIKIYEDCNEVV